MATNDESTTANKNADTGLNVKKDISIIFKEKLSQNEGILK